ncbi:hypothetical protein IFM89_005109 [Coptis chinensis]|uniref:Uncharacterized protein n=1 Tax=Coptis chinensis TaxID=261450 RepID=A0A835IJM6_9MAGN|nr:hypothetical protein IFM89_005109 [Coptis chinensis]
MQAKDDSIDCIMGDCSDPPGQLGLPVVPHLHYKPGHLLVSLLTLSTSLLDLVRPFLELARPCFTFVTLRPSSITDYLSEVTDSEESLQSPEVVGSGVQAIKLSIQILHGF